MRSVLRLGTVAAVLSICSVGCRQSPLYRPKQELRHGAAAAVPWAALALDAHEGAPRTWTLTLSNPFDAEVALAAPGVSGCNECIEARWEGSGVDAEGAVAIAPGASARLAIEYTGAPTGNVGRYLLEFRLARGVTDPLRVPLTVRFDAAAPYDPAALSARAIAGETAALAVPWRMRGALRPDSISAWSGSRALDAVAWPAGEAGSPGALSLASREPWKRFQAGVLRVRCAGDPSVWQVPWRCVAGSPFDASVLPGSGDGPSTLVLISNVGRGTTVSVRAADPAISLCRSVHLEPRERLHLSVPRLERRGLPGGTPEQLLVRMESHGYEARVSLP